MTLGRFVTTLHTTTAVHMWTNEPPVVYFIRFHDFFSSTESPPKFIRNFSLLSHVTSLHSALCTALLASIIIIINHQHLLHLPIILSTSTGDSNHICGQTLFSEPFHSNHSPVTTLVHRMICTPLVTHWRCVYVRCNQITRLLTIPTSSWICA